MNFMITRIVRLTIKPTHFHEFISTYSAAQIQIKDFEGCKELSLQQDKNDSNVVYTISRWDSEEHLNRYRNSNLFIGIWKTVKPMFAARADAWSMQEI